jgi:hypothetical protein
MDTLILIVERGDGEWWGRIEGKGDFLPVTVANTIEEVIGNMRMLIQDYLEHEGKEDPFWNTINPESIEFDIVPEGQVEED